MMTAVSSGAPVSQPVDREWIEAQLAGVPRGTLRPLLATTLALRVPGAVSRETAARWTAGVLVARKAWVRDFGGEQFTLGRALYTHIEQFKPDEYFRTAAASDALVEQHCPGLQRTMHDLLEHLLGEPSAPRSGFCGPGVHVFPPRRAVARRGGDLHFDLEGQTRAQLEARTPAITLVLMLSPPKRGGGLHVWDAMYDGSVRPPTDLRGCRSAVVPYAPGDLVAIDSYRLHRIQYFDGSRPRISATCHAIRVDGIWNVWF
jgi:hypothetical protein